MPTSSSRVGDHRFFQRFGVMAPIVRENRERSTSLPTDRRRSECRAHHRVSTSRRSGHLTVGAAGVNSSGVQTESVVSNPPPAKAKLTGGQKWAIAGLLVLQIPSSLIFFPLAAIFAITGIFVPIALVLLGIGTLPYSFAMGSKARWQGVGAQKEAAPPFGSTITAA
jgi:hypothetical protein